jgi:3-oxoacyl-[acyl-carrier protein] reductase
MDLGIAGRGAVVLGAGGGLGSAVACALAREGAHVAAWDISSQALDALAERADPGRVRGVVCDLRSTASIDRALEETAGIGAPASILVSFTGGPPPGPVVDVAAETWSDQFGAMVLPVFRVASALLPGMRAGGWGRIVVGTSSGVVAPIPNLGISNALRSSLVGWSKTLATEVAADGVTVNTVVPGRISTPRITALDEAAAERAQTSVEEVRARSLASIPMGRYGTPEEFADVIVFLASAAASYVTGAAVRVDGGLISSV